MMDPKEAAAAATIVMLAPAVSVVAVVAAPWMLLGLGCAAYAVMGLAVATQTAGMMVKP
jgi:hypothetical protein